MPNATSLAVGYSQTKKLMFTVSSCLGSLLTQMEKNPITQIVLARQMTQYFTNAVIGVDTDIDVVEAKVTPAKEED